MSVSIYGTLAFMVTMYSLSWFLLSSELLYRQKERNILVKFMIFFSIYDIILLFLMQSSLFLILESNIVMFLSTIMEYIGAASMLVWLYYKKNKGNLLKIASAVCVSAFFFDTISTFLITFRDKYTWGQESYNIEVFVWIPLYTLAMLLSLLIMFIFRKVEFRKHFSSLFVERKKAIITFLLCFLAMCLNAISTLIYPNWLSSSYYLIFCVVMGFASILIMLFSAIFETNKIKLNSQNAIILQQETYLQSLESLQKEMRAFRHDYKNMMSGLYLQANAGDIAGIQDFVKNSLQYFEHNLGDEIKQMTHLNNIHNMQVKSLLMVKQMEMQEKNIDFQLEVLK